MQPENQPGNGNPPQPQPLQQVPPVQPAPQFASQPQPVQQQPTVPIQQPVPVQQPVAPALPQVQPTLPPVVPPTTPVVESVQPPQPELQTPAVLGSVAVADQVDDGYGYASEQDDAEYEEGEIDLSQPYTWQAKEYIHQEKGMMWFVAFAIIIVVFLAVSILLMKSWSFSLVLVAIAAVVVVFSRRPPRVMEYALSEDGLHIDNTVHKYPDFKSFGIIRDGEEYSVMLLPRRRFQPGITVYFPEEAGEDIVDILGSRMPMRDLQLDAIDRLVRTLRL